MSLAVVDLQAVMLPWIASFSIELAIGDVVGVITGITPPHAVKCVISRHADDC